MRTRALSLPVLVLVVAPAVVTAQGAAPQPPAQSTGAIVSRMTLQPPKRANAQQYVFRIPTLIPKPGNPDAKRAVVCGLTVIDADPTFDAAIRKPAPRPDDRTTFTIKTIQPTVCTRAAR